MERISEGSWGPGSEKDTDGSLVLAGFLQRAYGVECSSLHCVMQQVRHV